MLAPATIWNAHEGGSASPLAGIAEGARQHTGPTGAGDQEGSCADQPWLNGTRTITEETAREIEAAANMPEGWLDTAPDSTDGPARRADVKATEELSSPYGTWPFCSVARERVMALSPEGLADLDEHLAIVVTKWEARARGAAKRTGA